MKPVLKDFPLPRYVEVGHHGTTLPVMVVSTFGQYLVWTECVLHYEEKLHSVWSKILVTLLTLVTLFALHDEVERGPRILIAAGVGIIAGACLLWEHRKFKREVKELQKSLYKHLEDYDAV